MTDVGKPLNLTSKGERRLGKTGKGRKMETKPFPVHHVRHEKIREQEKERSREGEMERVNGREGRKRDKRRQRKKRHTQREA